MTATEPRPPTRPAHLFDAEQGDSIEAAQSSLLYHFATLAAPHLSFHGAAEGEVRTLHNDATGLRLAFRCNLVEGVVDLTPAERGWVRADIAIDETHFLRVWLDQPYEEAEFWPDGATGEGDAPGRISKRGSWLTLDCASFPCLPLMPTGFWTIEEIVT